MNQTRNEINKKSFLLTSLAYEKFTNSTNYSSLFSRKELYINAIIGNSQEDDKHCIHSLRKVKIKMFFEL